MLRRGTHGGFDTVNGFVRGAIQEALEARASIYWGTDHNSLWSLVLELNWWIGTRFGVIGVRLTLRSWLWGGI